MKHLAEEIFAIFDKDGSGEITVDEFREAIESMDAGTPPTIVVKCVRGHPYK
jgi:Ca2+-binding EF-hand superfamily protein